MAFVYEQEMAAPAAGWLAGQRLMVKREFPTPWGICDLVGCSLNERRVQRRLSRGQRKLLRSQLRVHLLSLIPDRSSRRAVSLDELHRPDLLNGLQRDPHAMCVGEVFAGDRGIALVVHKRYIISHEHAPIG